MSEPIQRHRRSQRLRETENSAPAATAPAVPPAPAPSPAQGLPDTHEVSRSVRSRRSIQETRSDTQPLPDTPPEKKVPAALIIAICALLLVCIGLFTGQQFMNAYLRQQEETRRAQHETLLRAHPLEYRDLIEEYAGLYNLEPGYVASIILNESSYQPGAESSVGARGLMQLMEDTASWIARRIGDSSFSFDRLWEPETNIRYGCWYLGYLSGLFGGDPVCVTSAYHAGQGTVSGWLMNTDYSSDGMTLHLDTMPDGPTKIYAGRVTKDYAIYDALYFHHLNPLPVDPTP